MGVGKKNHWWVLVIKKLSKIPATWSWKWYKRYLPPSTILNPQYQFPPNSVPTNPFNQSISRRPHFIIHTQSVRGISTPLTNSSHPPPPFRGIIILLTVRSILHIHTTYRPLHPPTSYYRYHISVGSTLISINLHPSRIVC